MEYTQEQIEKATIEAKASWEPQASAYDNGDFISVKTYSSFSLSQRDPLAKEHLLPADASDEALGIAVLKALKQSRFLSYEEEGTLLEHRRENYLKWVKKIMDLYGYKTKRAMFKDMKSCGMSLHEKIITICPSYHEKLEAWSGDRITEADYVRVAVDSSPEEIGAALRLAFSRCKG